MSIQTLDRSQCPICSASHAQEILVVRSGNIDNSSLYEGIVVLACRQCGHAFNQLDAKDLDGIYDYYRNEYSPVNLHAADLGGDRPGSAHAFSTNRQEALYGIFRDYVSKDARVLDVGCALGGMLNYLKHQGYRSLNGIDISPSYVERAREIDGIAVEIGDAETIPHPDHVFDLVILDQVLEHLYEPRRAFLEMARVLKPGGFLAIGVPNAARYNDVYFFDYYWVLMREHIQHFDLAHLTLLARSCGFDYIAHRDTNSAMNSSAMHLPNLNVLYRYHGTSTPLANAESDQLAILPDTFRTYAITEAARLQQRISWFQGFRTLHRDVYIWGIGREWAYVFANTCAPELKIAGLIDSNPYKREQQTMNGYRIQSPDILRKAATDSMLIIAAVAHHADIETAARKLGFGGEILCL